MTTINTTRNAYALPTVADDARLWSHDDATHVLAHLATLTPDAGDVWAGPTDIDVPAVSPAPVTIDDDRGDWADDTIADDDPDTQAAVMALRALWDDWTTDPAARIARAWVAMAADLRASR